MMRTRLPLLLLLASATVVGCDDSSSPADTDGETDGQDTDDVGPACDPVGAQPEQAALFNAPLADDVEVVQKTPTHPGDPGPDALP